MASGYSGEFMYGGGGGAGRGNGGVRPSIGGNQTGGNVVPFGFRQQQQQFHQQQQQQGGGMMLQDQIAQRRVDLLMGKRSFGDYQSYQQQIQLLQQRQQQQLQQQQQQQQQQQPFSYLQKLQQQQQQSMSSQQPMSSMMNQYLLRSVKQRTSNNGYTSSPISPLSPTIDLCSPTHNNNNNILLNNNININNSSSSSTRFGVPVYQQPRQQQIPLNNNNYQLNPNPLNPSNNSFLPTQFINPVQITSGSGAAAGSGFGNPVINPSKQEPGSGLDSLTGDGGGGGAGVGLSDIGPEDQKILSTLQELEKHLLNDDDDFAPANDQDGDAVSGITNSEWSETFQNLMSPNPSPGPIQSPVQPSVSTSCSNATTTTATPTPTTNNGGNNNNLIISPSPTSSTSSCCSTSASAAGSPPATAAIPATTTATATVSAKQLISEVATAISEGKNDAAVELLSKLGQIADCKGNSEQRLAYYISNALRSRACPTENPPPVVELYGSDQMSAVYSLYDISPCFKFGLLAANLVMLEAITHAMQEGLKIHVIDFDVGHGAQYVNLLRALAERKAQLPCAGMRITVVETELGDHGAVPEGVRDSLVGLAERVGINLKYSCLTRAIHELTRESLGCEEGEAVVVNFAFKLYRVPDESVSMDNLRDELLRRVKGLSPRAVTLVEQDMNGNTAPFMTRVNEVCGYYGALFDSLEATLPRDNPDRCRVEEGLGRKMVNSVACEGRERVERAEMFGKWRARMGMAGFELKGLSPNMAESMRAKLNSARGGNPGFTVKEENGGVGFGWMGRSLTAASAWR